MNAVCVAAADTAFLLRRRNKPEVRHLHHDHHPTQHDTDGSRTLRAVRRLRAWSVRRQHGVHHHFHHRVHPETHQSSTALLQTGVERLRLRRRRCLSSWSVFVVSQNCNDLLPLLTILLNLNAHISDLTPCSRKFRMILGLHRNAHYFAPCHSS